MKTYGTHFWLPVIVAMLISGCEDDTNKTEGNEPSKAPSQTTSTKKAPADNSLLAKFNEQVENTTREWIFTLPRAAKGIGVRYLTHSQSLTNHEQNRVTTALSVNGGSSNTQVDSFDSQTDVGIPITGFWRSVTFPSAAVEKGDAVRLSLSVSAGDYRCYVSAVEVYAVE